MSAALETPLAIWFHIYGVGCNHLDGEFPCDADHNYQAAEFIDAFENTKELLYPTVFPDDDTEIRGY